MNIRHVVSFGLLLAVLGSAFGCRQSESGAEAANKQIVRNVYAAVDAHEFDQLSDLLAQDMICHMVGVPDPLDRNATIEFIKGAYVIFPDFTHELNDVLAEGNRVVVRITNHATHANEFEGLAPTGNRFQYRSVHIVTIEAGVIKEWWLLEDNLGLMTQLGMELVPAGVSAEEKQGN